MINQPNVIAIPKTAKIALGGEGWDGRWKLPEEDPTEIGEVFNYYPRKETLIL